MVALATTLCFVKNHVYMDFIAYIMYVVLNPSAPRGKQAQSWFFVFDPHKIEVEVPLLVSRSKTKPILPKKQLQVIAHMFQSENLEFLCQHPEISE